MPPFYVNVYFIHCSHLHANAPIINIIIFRGHARDNCFGIPWEIKHSIQAPFLAGLQNKTYSADPLSCINPWTMKAKSKMNKRTSLSKILPHLKEWSLHGEPLPERPSRVMVNKEIPEFCGKMPTATGRRSMTFSLPCCLVLGSPKNGGLQFHAGARLANTGRSTGTGHGFGGTTKLSQFSLY